MYLDKESWAVKCEEQLGIDLNDIMEVLDMFFEELPGQLLSLYNEQIEATIRKRAAHSLKSSGKMLCMVDVSDIAKDLEQQFEEFKKNPDKVQDTEWREYLSNCLGNLASAL